MDEWMDEWDEHAKTFLSGGKWLYAPRVYHHKRNCAARTDR
uniref:Ankyrin 1, erythrocytic n=1 Tax=Nothobranchius korthausae TaxID=1143690 RepID=A0A1A8EYH3_9TELE